MPTMLAFDDWIGIATPPHESWTDVDLDSYGAPGNVAGVFVRFQRGAGTSGTSGTVKAGIRPNGSTDISSDLQGFNDRSGTNAIPRAVLHVCGCDVNNIIEIYMTQFSQGQCTPYIIGWILDGEAEMFTNAVYSATGIATGLNSYSFSNANLNGKTPTAWLIGLHNGHSSGADMDVLPTAANNTLDRYGESNFNNTSHFIGGVIAGQNATLVDVYMGDTTSKAVFARGFLTSGYTTLTTPVTQKWSNNTPTLVTVSAAEAGDTVLVQLGLSTGGQTGYARTPGDARTVMLSADPFGELVVLDGSKQLEAMTGNNNTTGQMHIFGFFAGGVLATPPVYPPMECYYGVPFSHDFSVGWTDANPSDFAAIDLPQGLVIDSAGLCTGTPVEYVDPTPPAWEFVFTGDTVLEWDDYIPGPADNNTIEFEVKRAVLNNEFIYGCDDAANLGYWFLLNNDGTVWGHCYFTNGGAPLYAVHSPVMTADTWHTVRIYQGGTANGTKIMIDGGPVQAGQSDGGMGNPNGRSFCLGSLHRSYVSQRFNGRIRNLKMFGGDATGDPGATPLFHIPMNDGVFPMVDLGGTSGISVYTLGGGYWEDTNA